MIDRSDPFRIGPAVSNGAVVRRRHRTIAISAMRTPPQGLPAESDVAGLSGWNRNGSGAGSRLLPDRGEGSVTVSLRKIMSGDVETLPDSFISGVFPPFGMIFVYFQVSLFPCASNSENLF